MSWLGHQCIADAAAVGRCCATNRTVRRVCSSARSTHPKPRGFWRSATRGRDALPGAVLPVAALGQHKGAVAVELRVAVDGKEQVLEWKAQGGGERVSTLAGVGCLVISASRPTPALCVTGVAPAEARQSGDARCVDERQIGAAAAPCSTSCRSGSSGVHESRVILVRHSSCDGAGA